jgi:DNA-binding response OmpR family regulator
VSKQILIVDDEDSVRVFLSTLLQHSGFATYRAGDALAALELLEEVSPDLIILDVMLPGMDGIELCRLLRARAETAQIPILIHSGRSYAESISHAFQAGANAYLAKPCELFELVAKVESLLGVRNGAGRP